MPTNRELEVLVSELEGRVKVLESEAAYIETDLLSDADGRFRDLLYGTIEALVRTRSAGAWRVAEGLRDKYLDPDIPLGEFGDQFTTTKSLLSGGKE